MGQQVAEALLQEFRVERRAGQHKSLVKVVRVRPVALEEPALNRRQGNFPANRALLGLEGRGRRNHLGQRRDRGMLEELLGREAQPGLVSAGYYLDTLDR